MNDIGPETLDRTIKQLVDSGEATIAEAYAIFAGYKLIIDIDATNLAREDGQTALLTLVTLASRVFHGGVYVEGCRQKPLLVPLPLGSTLQSAVLACGGRFDAAPEGAPRISIGGALKRRERFHVRTVFDGWRGGIVPADFEDALSGPARPTAMPLAPVLAAAIAIAEAFEFARTSAAAAGHFPVGMSLWGPGQRDWLTIRDDAPPLSLLPEKLWLIGLGHIGQACLWCLGVLPYASTAPLKLVLQDVDKIGRSTPSTSILSAAGMIGQYKTRMLAGWCEQRGFQASLIERLFDDRFRVSENDPAVALCGLDNLPGRRALDKVGFGLVIESGLGSRHDDFRSLRVHSLPGRRTADEIWKDAATTKSGEPGDEAVPDEYRRLRDAGVLDQCGMTTLAGKAVGAAFVGCFAATLAVSELLRLLHGGMLHESLDVDLRALGERTATINPTDLSAFNPGFVPLL